MNSERSRPLVPVITKKRHATRAKGLRLERLAQKLLETQGYLVQPAQSQVKVIKDGEGKLRFIPVRVDLFGLWDLVCVIAGPPPVPPSLYYDPHTSPGTRCFVQVTTAGNLAARRRLILQSGFPCRNTDMILAWKGGRGRHFRIFRGPEFDEANEECLCPTPE